MEVRLGKTIYFTTTDDPYGVGDVFRYVLVDEDDHPLRMKYSGSSSQFYATYPLLSIAETRAEKLNRAGLKVRVFDKHDTR